MIKSIRGQDRINTNHDGNAEIETENEEIVQIIVENSSTVAWMEYFSSAMKTARRSTAVGFMVLLHLFVIPSMIGFIAQLVLWSPFLIRSNETILVSVFEGFVEGFFACDVLMPSFGRFVFNAEFNADFETVEFFFCGLCKWFLC